MKPTIFFLGFFLGIAFAVTFYSTLPLRWGNENLIKKENKLQGKINLVIGYDPDCQYEWQATGMLGSK